MARNEKIKIIVAETSPIIAAGLIKCLRDISALNFEILEVKNIADLQNEIKRNHIQLVIVSPIFGGILNPGKLRDISENRDLKIIGIEIGKLNRQAVSLYDDIISVTDDLETLGDKIKKIFRDKQDNQEEKESLSSREKEIISLVVKGLTNQEIADKLFLSIHTVITHRRNIARKLEIHSATGLTIYAIVNKIVELSDIKI